MVVMCGAMAAMSALLAAMRTALEFVWPTYSGLGPWRPFVELPIDIMVFAAFLILMESFATFVNWKPPHYRSHLVVIGCVCAMGASGPLVVRATWPLLAIAFPDLLIIGTSLAAAMVARYWFGRATGTASGFGNN
jgi:uncharacterized membrane protein